MAKLKRERIIIKDHDKESLLDFYVDIHVTQSGEFTTTLPEDIAERFLNAGINLSTNGNRNARRGYFNGKTLDELVSRVRKSCEEYSSRELVKEEIVIRYVINTTCTYIRFENGFFSNGNVARREGFNPSSSGGYLWSYGSRDIHPSNPAPFGFLLWTAVCIKREYKYTFRANKVEYDCIQPSNECRDNLFWLASISSNKRPDTGDLQEIPYTEEVAEFFVNLYKSIFMINERVKSFNTPEGIMDLIKSKKSPLFLN